MFIRTFAALLLLLTQSSAPAFLGVEMDPESRSGVRLVRVVQESAAERAGMVAEDVILGIAGSATDTPDELREVMAKHAAGDTVQVVFRRGHELHVVDTTLGERPPDAATLRARKVERIVKVLKARPGDTVADIGFGTGWLSRGLAEFVGAEGFVYAVEIDPSKVESLRAEGAANIRAVHSEKNDVSIPSGCLDIAVLHDVASHVDRNSRPGFYASIAKALKADGRLVVFGPHGKAQEMLDELGLHGFRAEDLEQLSKLSSDELDKRLADGIRLMFRVPDRH